MNLLAVHSSGSTKLLPSDNTSALFHLCSSMIGDFTSQETALRHYVGSTTRDMRVFSHKTAARVHGVSEEISVDIAAGLFIIVI